MAQDYIKTKWVDSETIIDANKLNNIETQLDILTDEVVEMNQRIEDLSSIEGIPGPQGEKGDKGDKGDQGEPGEDADMELVNSLAEQLANLSSKVNNLEIKLHYIESPEKETLVEAVDLSASKAKIIQEPGKVLKAVRLVNVPENSVKWRNTCSSFFGMDENGAITGSSNPSNIALEGTKFEHIGNLDPMLGIQQVDKIEDLYSILCEFDFEKAQVIELESLKQYFPETIKIKFVRHAIEILDDNEKVVKKINIDCYPN